MAFLELALIITLVITLGAMVVIPLSNSTEQRQIQSKMENAFYQLLREQDSCVSLIQLTSVARVDAQVAQKYLEQQAKIFGAILEADADGNTFYRFPKIRLEPKSDQINFN